MQEQINPETFCKSLGLNISDTEIDLETGIVRSPFYVGFMFPLIEGSTISKRLSKSILQRSKKYEALINYNGYAEAIFTVERAFRLVYFLKHQLDCEINCGIKYAGNLCATVWTDSENPGVNIDIWRRLFKYYGKNLMSDKDLNVWNALPDQFKVWHGDEGEGDANISWTLDKKVAEFFAKRFTNNPRLVYERVVNKSDCLCYLGGRNEQEILILDQI